MKKLLQAARFAAEKHSRQKRKDAAGTPYVNHCIKVAELLATIGGVTEEDVLCAALLHDTVEDTDTKLSEIETLFGVDVAEMVREVTDDKSLPSEKRKRLQIEHAPQLSIGAAKIKLADKICNVREIPENPPIGWSIERQYQYVVWAFKVVNALDISTNYTLMQAFFIVNNHAKTYLEHAERGQEYPLVERFLPVSLQGRL